SYSLKEFFEVYPDAINSFPKDFLDRELLKYLLREGYIDEMYTSLISYFYEGALTKADMGFLLSIKQRKPVDFTLKLSKIEEVIKSITLIQLGRNAILNHSFIDFLLTNGDRYNDQQAAVFSNFTKNDSRYVDFFFSYLDAGKQHQLFIAALGKHWPELWITISSDNRSTLAIKDTLLRNLIITTDPEIIQSQNVDSSITEYVSDKPDFLSILPEKENVRKMMVAMNSIRPKFKNLAPTDESLDLLNHIHKNNFYAINESMISLLVQRLGKGSGNEDHLATANYSAISNSGCAELIAHVENNIDEYISNVFLKLEYNTSEPEDMVIKLLNNPNITLDNKKTIIEVSDCKLKNISNVPKELWADIVTNEKMVSNWFNVLRYFANVSKIDPLLASYLNNPFTCIELAEEIIEADEETEDEKDAQKVVDSISKELIQNQAITDDAFKYLVKSISEKYEGDLDLPNISDKKIRALIEDDILAMTPANFNGLKKNNAMRLLLIRSNFQEFLTKTGDYGLEPADYIMILSSEIAMNEKLSLIEVMPTETFTGQQRLADLSSSLLSNASVTIVHDKLKKILTYSSDVHNRIILFINQLSGMSTDQIDDLLGAIGEPFSVIAERGKKPQIPLTPENHELVKKLQEMAYISSFKIESDENRIRVYTRLSSESQS
ncbi:MAG TPA: hypothetical protein VFI06_01150, partial [Chitinophagaceae bacterium]|nr:hypothetical protein [Chitinophagaceae bacterium]